MVVRVLRDVRKISIKMKTKKKCRTFGRRLDSVNSPECSSYLAKLERLLRANVRTDKFYILLRINTCI